MLRMVKLSRFVPDRWGAPLAALLMGVAVSTMSPVWGAERYVVGVLNQQVVIEKSKTGRKALDELKAYSAARQKIIASDEDELKSLEATAKESGLKDEQRREKESLFRTKLDAYQRRIQGFNQEIQQKQNEMVAEYSTRIGAAAEAVAKRHGYAAVIDEGAETNVRIVIYHHPSVDMTDEVIKEFDARVNRAK